MRKLTAICNRLSRREGVRLCVVSPRRGVYRLHRYSVQLDGWCYVGTFGTVADCADYLMRYER